MTRGDSICCHTVSVRSVHGSKPTVYPKQLILLCLQLIIPGSGLETGTEEAKMASLPEYAGVQGVVEAEGPSTHSADAQPEPQGGWTTGLGIKLPGFSGAGGVQQGTE